MVNGFILYIEMLWPLLLEYSCRQFYESNIVNFPFMFRGAIDDASCISSAYEVGIKGDSDTFFSTLNVFIRRR